MTPIKFIAEFIGFLVLMALCVTAPALAHIVMWGHL